MAMSKLLQIWISNSEQLDDEMRLNKNSDNVKKKMEDIINKKNKMGEIVKKKKMVEEEIINKKEKVREDVFNLEETASNLPVIENENLEKRYTCQICKFTTKYPGSLKHHKLKGCKKHNCNQCTNSKAFTKEELKKHKIKEHKFSPAPWLSDLCHICPDSSHTLRMHSSKGFSKEHDRFVCDTCKKLFQNKNDVNTHLKTSFNCFRMKCPKCDFKTYIVKSFCRHKCEPKKSGDQIACEECDFKDKSAAKVIERTGVAHDGIVKKCDFCLFTSPFSSDLTKHSRETHNVNHHLMCNDCPFVGKNKFEIKNHKEQVHAIYKIDKDGTVGCLFCDFKSGDKSRKLRNGKATVKRHYMTFHKKIKQTCDICELRFSNKSSLSLHKTRKHEPVVKDLKCTYCDYRTGLKWILNRHIGRIHEGHRIKCPHCHYKGYEKRNVQNHIKMYHMHQQTEMYTGASEYLRSVLKLDLDLKPFNMQKSKELLLI